MEIGKHSICLHLRVQGILDIKNEPNYLIVQATQHSLWATDSIKRRGGDQNLRVRNKCKILR